MFTGIIETLGTVRAIEKDQSNVHFTVESAITHELKIDQSVAHNGCCLTVVKIDGDSYVVTAIQETLDKTNLGELEVGSKVNLERCMLLGARLDGHIVQGHVDTTATCVSIEDLNGSWKYTFRYDFDQPTVAKGSITVNGVSLTVVDSEKGLFSVCIIPYTQEHTNFHSFKVGTKVNLEFDIIGKYVARLMEQQKA
ncbi:MAG: riboflavin synthase, alpha subunit [Fluviicola sp.]|jgi:riboflavin synthase|uniref:riboflavin synthase n=1 Tax=Fluviicola sp. TaxID=1917219 RepID=UPI0026114AE0|nr:riboflavin synthase [Fluviicola sp.]MDF3028034.1 riboflavin synthase, alpha subunit [Fluviicola sp.]